MKFAQSPEVFDETKKVKKKLVTFVFKASLNKSQELKGFYCDEMVMIMCIR